MAEGLAGLAAPVDEHELREAEELLGFALPAVVREVYLAAGARASGERESQQHLIPPVVAAQSYLQRRASDQPWEREEPSWVWPEHLVPVCDRGCGILLAFPADTVDPNIWVFDPNRDHPETGAYLPPWPTRCTFRTFMEHLARGRTLVHLWDDAPELPKPPAP